MASNQDLLDLEEDFYAEGDAERGAALSPEVVGAAILLATKVVSKSSQPRPDLPERQFELILRRFADAPTEVRAFLHLERRLDGRALAEAPEMADGAQELARAARMNPENTRLYSEVDGVQARILLSQLRSRFPAAIDWIVAQVHDLLGGETANEPGAMRDQQTQ